MASASDRWPKYWAAWDEWRPGLASQAPRRVSPGYFRLALADAQPYDDVIGNFPPLPRKAMSA
jgi:hypothetical protein